MSWNLLAVEGNIDVSVSARHSVSTSTTITGAILHVRGFTDDITLATLSAVGIVGAIAKLSVTTLSADVTGGAVWRNRREPSVLLDCVFCRLSLAPPPATMTVGGLGLIHTSAVIRSVGNKESASARLPIQVTLMVLDAQAAGERRGGPRRLYPQGVGREQGLEIASASIMLVALP